MTEEEENQIKQYPSLTDWLNVHGFSPSNDYYLFWKDMMDRLHSIFDHREEDDDDDNDYDDDF